MWSSPINFADSSSFSFLRAIEVAICFLKILYDLEPRSIDTHLNNIKQVTSSLKKMFEKGFESSSKNSSQNRVYELPPLS